MIRQGLLIFFGVLIGVVASELILRAGLFPNPQYARMTLRGEKKNPEHRLLILGDSFIDSRGDLDNLLTPKMKIGKTAVLNAAVSSMGPVQYLTQFNIVVGSFKPDIVLLSYYAGNDLSDVKYYPLKGFPQGKLEEFKNVLRPFLWRLYLYHLMRHVERVIKFSLFDIPDVDISALEIPAEVKKLKQSGEKINLYHVYGAKRYPGHLKDNLLVEGQENKDAWGRVAEIISLIKKKCDEIDAELVIVIFPNTLQVSRRHEYLYSGIFGYELDARIFDSRIPQDLLLKYCETNKLACLDLLPFFEAEREDLYLPFDDHLNDKGNRLSAEVITDFLKPHLKK